MIRRIEIHDQPLPRSWCDAATVIDPRSYPEHGAVCSFLGVVRNHARGRAVTGLVYECYRPMAEKMLADLIAEAAKAHDPALSAAVAHGSGAMVPGDVSVAIHVASAHRDAAFAACRQLIERIKQDLPVWKREMYGDGTTAWLKGS